MCVLIIQISLFSRQCLQLLMIEDSGHYMLYSFFFYNQIPQIGQLPSDIASYNTALKIFYQSSVHHSYLPVRCVV